MEWRVSASGGGDIERSGGVQKLEEGWSGGEKSNVRERGESKRGERGDKYGKETGIALR